MRDRLRHMLRRALPVHRPMTIAFIIPPTDGAEGNQAGEGRPGHDLRVILVRHPHRRDLYEFRVDPAAASQAVAEPLIAALGRAGIRPVVTRIETLGTGTYVTAVEVRGREPVDRLITRSVHPARPAR